MEWNEVSSATCTLSDGDIDRRRVGCRPPIYKNIGRSFAPINLHYIRHAAATKMVKHFTMT